LDGGRSRGGQSVATYVKRGATYAKGGGSTSRGQTRRGSVGSAGGALPNRTHLQCFGRYPVTSSLRSRSVLPRGKPQAESAGGSPPRPRGLGPGRRGSQSGPLGGEAAPAWKRSGLLLPEADFYKFNRRQSGTSIEVPDCQPDQNRTSIEVPDCLRLTFKSPPPGSDDIITTD
jgi:hypothetical protein